MQIVIHPAHERDANDGEFKSYTVRVKTSDRRVNRVLRRQGATDFLVSVYAYGPHAALDAGIEKAQDKWLRHHDWLVNDWVALDVVED
jgi:hypothetical protein